MMGKQAPCLPIRFRISQKVASFLSEFEKAC